MFFLKMSIVSSEIIPLSFFLPTLVLSEVLTPEQVQDTGFHFLFFVEIINAVSTIIVSVLLYINRKRLALTNNS
jgi:hypothetical protein